MKRIRRSVVAALFLPSSARVCAATIDSGRTWHSHRTGAAAAGERVKEESRPWRTPHPLRQERRA